MFMILKKKQLLIATLVIMLGVAGYLNYRYDGSEDAVDVLSVEDEKSTESVGDAQMVNANVGETVSESEEDYFATYRFEREKSRAKTKEDLEKILSNSTVSEDAKKSAEEKLASLSTASQTETTAETVLKSKGFEDVIVFINNDSVNVTVKTDGLSSSDTAKIIDVVYELTKNNNIKIVEVE